MKIVLGTERRTVGCGYNRKIAEVEDTMVYVPVLSTIQCLLNNDALVAEVKYRLSPYQYCLSQHLPHSMQNKCSHYSYPQLTFLTILVV